MIPEETEFREHKESKTGYKNSTVTWQRMYQNNYIQNCEKSMLETKNECSN